MINFIDKLLGISEKYQREIDELKSEKRNMRENSLEILSGITSLSRENKHLRKGLEKLYRESTKVGHIRKEKVQLMCMEALQVPK